VEPAADDGANGRDIGLVAGDGNRFAAYEATPRAPSGSGVIVLPDYYGLGDFHRELALRFAETGVDALVIDYYGRTAEPPPRAPDFDHRAHAQRTTWAGLQVDIDAAAAHLRLRRHVHSLFAVGFCFGGRTSFLLAAAPALALSGVIGFYGWPVGPFLNDTPAPVDTASAMAVPVLALFGGADTKIPHEDVEAFREALQRAGVPHEVRTYDGAPHSFFDRAHPDHAAASADAWGMVRRFLAAHAAARS
jgi:carboxymethylenebutenolidase